MPGLVVVVSNVAVKYFLRCPEYIMIRMADLALVKFTYLSCWVNLVHGSLAVTFWEPVAAYRFGLNSVAGLCGWALYPGLSLLLLPLNSVVGPYGWALCSGLILLLAVAGLCGPALRSCLVVLLSSVAGLRVQSLSSSWPYP